MAIVLITGTSSGIGFATAVMLARAGHTVAATMRDPRTESELARVAGAENSSVQIFGLDVDDDASVTRAFDTALARHGHIDVLVNNAGNQPSWDNRGNTDRVVPANHGDQLFWRVALHEGNPAPHD